ncbi:MAG: hypothetical protein LBP64_10775, partial [Tannerella sp.]|nr:hypothetical protein [Tannerella sp.]
KQKGNVVTHGLSGQIGGMLVFRQRAGRTIVSKMPEMGKEATEAQLANRRKFQRATLYSTGVMSDPKLAEAYASKAKPGQSARNVAVADFFHAPDIETIDVTDYRGLPGDVIRIEVTDDFMVKEVKVEIYRSDGALVEEGYAVQEPVGYEWKYVAKVENLTQEGERIEVFASDLPGNISEKTKEL